MAKTPAQDQLWCSPHFGQPQRVEHGRRLALCKVNSLFLLKFLLPQRIASRTIGSVRVATATPASELPLLLTLHLQRETSKGTQRTMCNIKKIKLKRKKKLIIRRVQ
jgi:hypothetical protein